MAARLDPMIMESYVCDVVMALVPPIFLGCACSRLFAGDKVRHAKSARDSYLVMHLMWFTIHVGHRRLAQEIDLFRLFDFGTDLTLDLNR